MPSLAKSLAGLDLNAAGVQIAANTAAIAALSAQLDARDQKASVRLASTANLTLSGTQTIDGVACIAGDRVAAIGQTLSQNSGIYVVAAGAWSRATDADTSAEVTSGMFFWVAEGTANGDKAFELTTDDPIVLGTTPLTFQQFAGGLKASQIVNDSAVTGATSKLALETLNTAKADLGTAIAFSAAVPFAGGVRFMAAHTVNGATAFTVNSTGAVAGASVYLRLESDGINTPSFTGMVEHGSSMGYDGRLGVINIVDFWYDGVDYFYSISQRVDATALVLRFGSFSGTVAESGSGTAGWSYANSSGTAATSVPDKTLAASASGQWSFSVAGHNPATQNSAFIGMTTTGARAGYTTFDFTMYGESGAGAGKYRLFASGVAITSPNGDPNVVQAVGDWLRARRTGTSLIFEVSKDGGNTYTVVHTFSGSSVKLYPQIGYTGPAQANTAKHSGLT